MIRLLLGERSLTFPGAEVLIGRTTPGTWADLDLHPDLSVSRRHARIWEQDGEHWLEDRTSDRGTRLNDQPLSRPSRIQVGDRIQIGSHQIEVAELSHAEAAGAHPEASSSPAALLAEIACRLAEGCSLRDCLQWAADHLAASGSPVQRAALLVGEELRLLAHSPEDTRPSTRLARQAIEARRALFWPPQRPEDGPPPEAVTRWHYPVASALYVPLFAGGRVEGCLALENMKTPAAFAASDLPTWQAIAAQLGAAAALDRVRKEQDLLLESLENFARLVPGPVGAQLRRQRGRIKPGGRFCEITVLFADLRGFTRMSAGMRADDVTEMIGHYFERLVPAITSRGGMLDKYIGDAVMAIFGSPAEDADHALHAVQAGLAVKEAAARLNTKRRDAGLPVAEVAVGLHSGEAVHGFSGTRDRMEFTAIGDTVNRASRFCDGARGGEVLISPEVHERVWRSMAGEILAQPTTIPTKHEGDLKAFRVEPAPMEFLTRT